MDDDVIEARNLGGRVVWLRFRDGTAGEIDLKSSLKGPFGAAWITASPRSLRHESPTRSRHLSARTGALATLSRG